MNSSMAPVYGVASHPGQGVSPVVMTPYGQPPISDLPRPGAYHESHRSHVQRMAISQIAMGVTLLVCGMVAVALSFAEIADYTIFGFAIVMGILLTVSGAIGLLAWKRNRFCWIVGCMVLNILSSVGSAALVCLLALGFGLARSRTARCNMYEYPRDCLDSATPMATAILNIVSLAMVVVQIGITIAMAALSCKAVCCLSLSNQNMVLYQLDGPQPLGDFQPNMPGRAPVYTGCY